MSGFGIISWADTTLNDDSGGGGVTPVEDSIDISTSSPATVNKDLWGFSVLHMMFTGSSPANYVVKDILSTAFKNIVISLNPTSLNYVGAALANVEQVVPGRTTIATANSGFNCPTECSFGGGECCPTTPFGTDFFLQCVELCRVLSLPLDHISNIQLPNVTWQAQIAWKLTHCTNVGVATRHIVFGIENVTSTYDVYWIGVAAKTPAQFTAKAAAYVAKANPELITLKAAYPSKKFYFDGAAIASAQNRDTLWNTGLLGYTNDGTRQYFNLQELLSNPTQTLSRNYDTNLQIINQVVNTSLPQRLAAFKTYFTPKKLAIWQWGLRNPGQENIENTVLGMLFQAKVMKVFLDFNYANTDYISTAYYQGINQFVNTNNTTTSQINGLLLLGKIFLGTPVYYVVDFPNDDVSGFCVKNGSTYKLFIINDGDESTQNVSVNGTEIPSWSRETYYGTSLSSTTMIHETVTESELVVPQLSISILTW